MQQIFGQQIEADSIKEKYIYVYEFNPTVPVLEHRYCTTFDDATNFYIKYNVPTTYVPQYKKYAFQESIKTKFLELTFDMSSCSLYLQSQPGTFYHIYFSDFFTTKQETITNIDR